MSDLVRLRKDLVPLARMGAVVTYAQLAEAQGIVGPGRIRRLGEMLEDLMGQDAAIGAPFLASVVVSKASGKPAVGFFETAARLNSAPVSQDLAAEHRAALRQL